MPKIIYRKDSGDVSNRDIVPIGFNFGDRDTVLCIDLSKSKAKEADKALLSEIRDDFIDSLYEAGFQSDIRSFILENIEDVK